MGKWISGFITGSALFLSFHSTAWGRIGAVLLAFILTAIIVKSMNGAGWRCLMFLIIPIGLFLLTTYIAKAANVGMHEKEPAQVADDLMYYADTSFKSITLKGDQKEPRETKKFNFFTTREQSIHWTFLVFLCFPAFLSVGLYDQRDCAKKRIKNQNGISD